MKYIFIILVLSGILVQNLNKIIIVVNFHLNREYIAKNICVQKEVKDNCCQGTCHLKEQLEETEEKEKAPSTSSFKSLLEIPLFYQSFDSIVMSPFDTGLNSSTPYIPFETSTVSNSTFHPPKA